MTCQKWKVKLIFRGAYRLSGTGIVECLEIGRIGKVICKFDGLTGLTLTHHILRQTDYFYLIYSTFASIDPEG